MLASLAGVGAMHVTRAYLPDSAPGSLGSALVFALVYVIAARLILREEYGYVLRAILQRKSA
jgi:hypothetical protein